MFQRPVTLFGFISVRKQDMNKLGIGPLSS